MANGNNVIIALKSSQKEYIPTPITDKEKAQYMQNSPHVFLIINFDFSIVSCFFFCRIGVAYSNHRLNKVFATKIHYI